MADSPEVALLLRNVVYQLRDRHLYLKGSLLCGRCKTRLYEQNITNRHGTTYPYFVCRGRSVEGRRGQPYSPAG